MNSVKPMTKDALAKLIAKHGTVQLLVAGGGFSARWRLVRPSGLCTFTFTQHMNTVLSKGKVETLKINISCFYGNAKALSNGKLDLKHSIQIMFNFDRLCKLKVKQVWTADGQTCLYPIFKEFK